MRVLSEHHLEERATGEGEAATRALRASIDAVVVVGGVGPGGFGAGRVPHLHVQGAADLALERFLCCATALVLAGPDAAPAEVEAVRRALESIRAGRPLSRTGA